MFGLNPLAADLAFRDRQVERHDFYRLLARQAVRSLHQELVLYPKPGLVSLMDTGSHEDMDAATFMRSLFSLRRYFADIGTAGAQGASFQQLKQLGIAAERRMLRATAGVNTHRGAIFCLGMLCAAIAYCHARRMPLSATNVRRALLMRWGDQLAAHAQVNHADSNGLRMAAMHAVGGARQEGALGFPAVFDTALPRLRATLASGRDWQCAKIDAFFALMAGVSDTNVYYRGGAQGAAIVRARSGDFLAGGGTAHPDWLRKAQAIHREFMRRRLSPGGAADLLAAACLIHAVCDGQP
jgi:triphosphoribosyl-dephospho-CoA synthase